MAKVQHSSATTRKVLKVLGVFGGVQVVNILCSIIRTKLIALWLGPAGVGLLSIYNNTMQAVANTVELNLNQSAVRDLSATRTDPRRGPAVVAAVRRLALFLGIAGTVLVIASSPLLSRIAFGNSEHTWAFAALSLWVIFYVTAGGEGAILRAYDKLKQLARSSIYATLAAIITTVPLLYYLRLDGIVPVIVVNYGLVTLFVYIYRLRSVPEVRMSFRRAYEQSKDMIKLGGYMTLSTTITLLASSALVIYLNRCYDQSTVGIYQAGYTLINTYVGIIFTAIMMEYYPRLCSVAQSAMRTEIMVSHEIKVTQSILLPVSVAFICLSGVAVRLLYSADFESVLPYITVGAMGVFFRAGSWCMACTILARGDGRIYVLTELSSAVAYLALHIPLFNAFGYLGLGIAYVAWYGVYYAVVYIVYRRRYHLRLRRGCTALTLLGIFTASLALAGYYLVNPYVTLAVLLLPTLYISYKLLLK